MDRLDLSKVGGMDTSHWNGVVDFQKGRAAGLSFVFIKACNGLLETKYWRENWAGAKAAGLPRGAYLWLYPAYKYSVKQQAQKWWSLLEADPGEMPPVIDFETTSDNGVPCNPDASDLYGAVEEFRRLSGIKPIIYTGFYYWKDHGSTASYWAQYDLWIARYGATEPLVPVPFPTWKFWQWTETGDGVYYGHNPQFSTAADLNYFNGDASAFSDYVGGYTPPPPPSPPTGDAMIATGKVLASPNLNIRSAPDSSVANGIGKLLTDDVIDIVEINASNWVRFTKIMRGTSEVLLPGPVCWSYAGATNGYIAVTPVAPPPPPPAGDVVVDVTAAGVSAFHQVYPAGTKISINVE